MIFDYKAINQSGVREAGTVEAFGLDAAISSLQKRGFVVSDIRPRKDKKGILENLPIFNRVSNKDVVILSRQMATLFQAQVSALRIFKLISAEVENLTLRDALLEVVNDLQGGSSISMALSKHPNIFSEFYVNMIKAGEESGKIDETFNYLADYLDRTYEVTAKAKNALIYPAFIIFTFVAVMVLMFTVIIPKISVIILESGQEVPMYTKIVFALSDFLINYGLYLFAAIIGAVGFGYYYSKSPEGAKWISNVRLSVPYVGDLYKKLYISRFSDNMSTMVSSGIPMLKAMEVTSSVVDSQIYKDMLNNAVGKVKTGSPLSTSLENYDEYMPKMLVQMIRVGEESGELGNILKTMAKFYEREVVNAVDTLVGLIEPVMIVSLGVGVGVLLASVLMPIYNIADSVQ